MVARAAIFLRPFSAKMQLFRETLRYMVFDPRRACSERYRTTAVFRRGEPPPYRNPLYINDCKEKSGTTTLYSIILVSSDSDFWSVIEDVDAKYMVLVESDKCGQTFKEILREHDIFYCYLDKFIIPEKDQYFQSVFRYELKRILSRDSVLPNARVLFDEALRQSRATITGSQKEKLYNKYIKGLKLSIDKDGNIEIVVPEIE